MGSEQKDATSYQPSEPKLCANNCGFFGNAGTMNLCSKCYRDYKMAQEKQVFAKAAMEKSLNPESVDFIGFASAGEPYLGNSSFAFSSESSSSATSASTAMTFGSDHPERKVATRCANCNKKVGLTGFQCKCGSTFCGVHRYPEKHECDFDFKGEGRDAIAKANPLVKTDKVERI